MGGCRRVKAAGVNASGSADGTSAHAAVNLCGMLSSGRRLSGGDVDVVASITRHLLHHIAIVSVAVCGELG